MRLVNFGVPYLRGSNLCTCIVVLDVDTGLYIKIRSFNHNLEVHDCKTLLESERGVLQN